MSMFRAGVWTSLALCFSFAVAGPPTEAPAAASPAPRAGKLEAWRAVKQEGTAALQVQDLPGKIEKCEAFLKAHPDFEERKPVLEALADAYVDSGSFNGARVGKLLEEIAAEDPDDVNGPLTMVQRYHIKHGLPQESAARLLAMARERLPRARAKIADLEQKEWRESQELSLKYREAQLEQLDGELRLVHDDNTGALGALQRALTLYEAVPHGIALRARGVTAPPSLNTGLLDRAHLALAVAYVRNAKAELARAEYAAILETPESETGKKWDAEVRKALALGARGGTVVSAEPAPAQDWKLKDMDGKEVKLSDFRGKVVILDFWATWCHWCLVEMPLLDKFQKAHPNDVVLLTIDTDRFEDRANIKPTLEKLNLAPTVLYEDAEQLTAYQYGALPSLYVVDREGKLAMAKTGYDPDTREKLTALVSGMLEGKPTPGRTLATIAQAPAGFGLRWKQPLNGRVDQVAIGAPVGSHTGQVATLGGQGLARWSATGAPLGKTPVQGNWWRGLRAADLDGNGTREWIAMDYRAVNVLDTDGVAYWKHQMSDQSEFVRVAGADDKAVVVKAGKTISAIGTNSKVRWTTERIADLEVAKADPRGGVVYQAGTALKALDVAGKPVAEDGTVPTGRKLAARMAAGGGTIDFFTGPWDSAPNVNADIDGDGTKDIVVVGSRNVRAYTISGKVILSADTGEENIENAAVGDLDGKPGDEIALLIDKYGLVVLGK